ncbi:MAG: TetR family transcriptional regulator [Microbacteriaceae bacterium]|jgi:AcrR family transcriptional regulator|nr:TetR family transcriptional regulator [Microbacteriaceae bacterium]
MSRAQRHNREDVLEAALRLLDTRGLPDLTMRALGAELGVQPGAIYWHFPSKQALLAALADRITDPVRAPAEGGWASRARSVARSLRTALFSHRDGAELVASSDALGLGGRGPAEALAQIFATAGLPADAARAASEAVLHFCLGALQREQQRAQAIQLGVEVSEDPVFQYRSGQLESPSESEDRLREPASPPEGGGYDFGVDLLLAGVRQALPLLSPAASPRGWAAAQRQVAGSQEWAAQNEYGNVAPVHRGQ